MQQRMAQRKTGASRLQAGPVTAAAPATVRPSAPVRPRAANPAKQHPISGDCLTCLSVMQRLSEASGVERGVL